MDLDPEPLNLSISPVRISSAPMRRVASKPPLKLSLNRKYSGIPVMPVQIVEMIRILVMRESMFFSACKNSSRKRIRTAAMVPMWSKIEYERASTGAIPSHFIMTNMVWPSLLMGIHSVIPWSTPSKTAAVASIIALNNIQGIYHLFGIE